MLQICGLQYITENPFLLGKFRVSLVSPYTWGRRYRFRIYWLFLQPENRPVHLLKEFVNPTLTEYLTFGCNATWQRLGK